MSEIFKKMAAAWPAPLVARSEVGRFSGGLLNARTLANMDCKGSGPANRLRVGRKIAYPTADLVAWMQSRVEPVDK